MPQACSICTHPQRAEIDRALCSGGHLRDLARQFGTSKDALCRHKKHIVAMIAKSVEGRDLASAANLISTVQGLITELEELKAQARQKRDGSEARKAIESILKSVSVLADLSGARAPQVHVNLQVPTSSEALAEAMELVVLLATPEQLADLENRVRERAGTRPPLLEGDVSTATTEAAPGAMEQLEGGIRLPRCSSPMRL